MKDDVLALSVDELGLSVRAWHGVTERYSDHPRRDMTIGDLVAMSATELRRLPNVGKVSVREIEEALAARGLRLRDHYSKPLPRPIERRRAVQIALTETAHHTIVYALADDGTIWRNWRSGIGDNQWTMLPPLP